MDSILRSNRLLNNRSWLYFRLYKDPASNNSWQNMLNWYHETLINVVRSVVNTNSDIEAVFFGFYGPEAYAVEEETYERTITAPGANVVFIRLRVAVKSGSKNRVKNAILTSIGNNGTLVWDYELMVTCNVAGDLGSRFGSNSAAQTLGFIRYWDAGCRYILSILTMPGNWIADVDVWGIPHLVNNSMGIWLRQERPPVICPNPNCGGHMYMNTVPIPVTFAPPITQIDLPTFVFICPRCQRTQFLSSNI